jgi:flagellin
MSFRINTNVSAMNAMRNLSSTGMGLAKSITRLSTGLRVNNAGDDPSGLIASEKFRAQLAGMDQALRNNQDAVNYAKTAEGALDEINRLLREARSLSVGYTGTLDSSQVQANQSQLNSILSSIDRISENTQYGTKKLLDGSSGVQATVVSSTNIASAFIGGTVGTQSITANGAANVDVTTAATRASHSGTNAVVAADQATYLAAAVGTAGSFNINGTTFNVSATDTWQGVINKINESQGSTGVRADVNYSGGSGNIVLSQNSYGANHKINLVDSAGVIQSAAGTATASGVNGVASVTVGALSAVTFTGGANGADGLTLSDSAGNTVKLTVGGNTVTTHTAAIQVTAGSANFQIGANAGQTTSLSLSNMSAGTLGIASLNITSQAGADAAMSAIDAAIEQVSSTRGNIGSFMRNTLESNIRGLGVARENLAATDSAIRDVDIAEEMTNFTKLQILQQSGLSVLAQANAAPQAVLGLLR